MCAQLYIQRAAQPDTWVMSGAPSATAIWLSRDTPINYSDGSTDTLPANTPAAVTGGGTSFDRTHDVYVPFTVKGSGVLSIVKESLLPTLTDAYAPLARVELHGLRPYQPEPYLAAGGLGTQPALTIVPLVSDVSALALDLWSGSSNNAPPSNWQTSAYDDSAWTPAVISRLETTEAIIYIAGTHPIWPTVSSPAGVTAQALFRQHVTLPAGLLTAATLQIACDDVLLGLWVNGTAIAAGSMPITFGPTPVPQTLALPAGVLLAGAENVIATWVQNDVDSGTGEAGLDDKLSVTYAGSASGMPAPASPAEGDLLYYHSGAWTRLPAGTNGDELTLVSGDPAWTAQPADTDTAGTVTSVALSGPTGTTVSGSPVTSSGTLSLAWSSQSANVVLASPNGSSGAPTFRALVGNDVPVDASTIVSSGGTIKGNYQAGSGVSISGNTISATGSGGSVTSVALSMPGIFSVSGSPITTSGTLAVSLATQSAHAVFAGPSSGSAAAPTFRALQSSDLPAAAGAGGKVHAHGHFL